ncbi:DUF4023 family protein [Ornithinibacillus salinisoli]|uniref:DUF4023 family protein n=1 Tax=Ornithinibacillus salinisoli TaxID=1848459 RepID=A0ABW4VWP3_9BACI
MEDTTQFVEKFNERKRKNEQTRKRQANGNKANRLPSKRH